MSDEIKSSWQIAMEKLQRLKETSGEEEVTLTPEQKRKIADLSKEYAAKIAEKEIMLQSDMKKLAARCAPGEFQAELSRLKEKFAEGKAALLREKDGKVEMIRKGKI